MKLCNGCNHRVSETHPVSVDYVLLKLHLFISIMCFRLVSCIFTLTFIFCTSSLNHFEMANEINLHYLYFNRKSTQYGTSDFLQWCKNSCEAFFKLYLFCTKDSFSLFDSLKFFRMLGAFCC